MSSPSVFFYVQHLWGVGHVYRATRIARGLSAAGMDVHLVWGGTRIPGFDFAGMTLHELPPVRTSDASFSELLHADGTPFSDQDKSLRAQELLALFDQVQPDILITEAFPFGRRQMRFELLPLLERSQSVSKPVMTVASIRDIMQEDRKPARVEESNALMRDFFDLVLVHGDPEFIRIEETLQGVETFAEKVRYTGLVTPELINRSTSEHQPSDVLVSVGGGAFGQQLLETALEAARLGEDENWNWLITTGTELSQNRFEQITDAAPEGVSVLRHLPDLRGAMAQTNVSVSHAGYNTVADILRAGCNSVLYPYTGGRETEQLRRATMMERLGIAKMIAPGELSGETLLTAIKASKAKRPKTHSLDLEGAENTAAILKREFDAFTVMPK